MNTMTRAHIASFTAKAWACLSVAVWAIIVAFLLGFVAHRLFELFMWGWNTA